jgi:hypothetical protein
MAELLERDDDVGAVIDPLPGPARDRRASQNSQKPPR